ncbi:aspartate kinase [Lactobacillus sp. S2-2]|uniref:aspartate kinase n=1 Tax=Lactobacillus sp. S2-2 TaxID=2692917 RepID=UPI001F017179|nr:aspartate kinase [Lactobacillus sp. S2-2]MCF6514921.1 aspartate kinase [Lactobacillus sp. S2-2]
MKVVKFGGSSLADGEHFQSVINIIKDDDERKAIVLSAPGKRFDNDTKVTDLLVNYANEVINDKNYLTTVKKIVKRYNEISEYFHLNHNVIATIEAILNDLPNQNYLNNEFLMATFKAHGEKLSAFLMNEILNELDIPAVFMDPCKIGIIVSNNPQNANILPETYTNLHKIKITNKKLIFPGFFGVTKHNEIATFARGGSDITGSIIAKGLNADLYENFTDVNAIYSANPKIVSNPAPIKKMTYREMRELAYAGFAVFNDEAIIPVVDANIPINVKNTNNPNAKGTMIVPSENFIPKKIITGVTSSKHFLGLYIHKYLLNKEVGFTLKILQILYKYNVSYEHMPSGIDDLTIIFDSNQLNNELMNQIKQEIIQEINPDKINWIKDYAIIMIVGEGLSINPSTIEKIFKPLVDNDIRIHMINQGASKISTMLGTNNADADRAVELIYQHFFDNNALNL